MKEDLHIEANNYLRDLHAEIYRLNSNQSLEDFLKFFIKDEVFTIGVICENKDKIKKYFEELSRFFGKGKKLVICDLDNLVQEWNKIIYLIKREKSLSNYFLKIIYNSILAKQFYYEKIGKKDYTINEAFYFYEISKHNELAIISNNYLLLEEETQRRNYIDKYINYISEITTVKKKRKSIPKRVKNELWINYFGEDVAKGKCYVCKTAIHITNFQSGHVVSDSNGGLPVVDNLRPVCGCCNNSMGEENLYEYKKRHYPGT